MESRGTLAEAMVRLPGGASTLLIIDTILPDGLGIVDTIRLIEVRVR